MEQIKKNKRERKHLLRRWWSELSKGYRKFREWQERPHTVDPMSEDEHVCATCQTHYRGNFCPRCGQSSRIGRYSFKTALLNFVNVWGLGNRSLTRTIFNLILRPGYLIRDYIKGMQMAYYPPFNMFFLFTAISLLVTHGLNIKGINYGEDTSTQEIHSTESTLDKTDSNTAEYVQGSTADKAEKSAKNRESEETLRISHSIADKIFAFQEHFPNIFAILILIFVSGLMYVFFRHSPNIPDLRYSELFVALVYVVNMYSVYSIILTFFCMPGLSRLTLLLCIIPFKQLSGYSMIRTTAKIILSTIIMFVLLIAIIIAMVFIIHGYIRMV